MCLGVAPPRHLDEVKERDYRRKDTHRAQDAAVANVVRVQSARAVQCTFSQSKMLCGTCAASRLDLAIERLLAAALVAQEAPRIDAARSARSSFDLRPAAKDAIQDHDICDGS